MASNPKIMKKSSRRPLKNVQLWISDLKKLNVSQTAEDVKSFSVMGVVVNVMAPCDLETSNRPIGYHVDDGTGVIKVCQFLRNRIQNQNAKGYDKMLPSSDPFLAELAASRCAFPVGTCVEAKGKLQEYRGETEMLAFSVRRVDDPNQEVERMEVVAGLRRDKIYPEETVGRNVPN
jgi:hypothetical protein